MELFDGHAHLSPHPEATRRLLGTMDALAITKAIVVAGGSLPLERLATQILFGGESHISLDNTQLLQQCQTAPTRLFPFYFANPHVPPDEYAAIGGNFSGLKLGPAVHGIPLTDPRTEAYLFLALRYRHPVYLHCLARKGFTVSELAELAYSFTDLNFILGHAGIGNCDFLALSLIEKIPNIFFETSGGFTAVIQEACRRLGHKRVLFGSEYPIQHPKAEIEKLRCLDLTHEQQKDIFGRNTEQLLARRFDA